MSKVSSRTEEIAKPIVEANGCSLWDVEYVKEAGSWYLRVYIDKDGGVSIDDCEAISKGIDPVLDELDFIPNSYIFEVCSAGADRILKKPENFKMFLGYPVDVFLYKPVDGSKSYTGILTSHSDFETTVEAAGGTIVFDNESVAMVRLHVDF